MKKGHVNIGYKGRRVAFANQNFLVGRADRYSTISYKDIIAYAAKAAAVPESSIEMSMEAIFDAVNYFVLNGHSVQIPNLGTFSLGVRAKTATNEVEFQNQFSNNLRGIDIRFLPDTELKAMIANTAITTNVNSAGYEGQATQLVSDLYFRAGSTLIPANAGRSYLIGRIDKATFSGKRLKAKHLGTTPVKLDYLDENGVQASVMLGSTYCVYDYYSLTVNLKKVQQDIPAAVWVKGLTLYAADGTTILKTMSFGGTTADPAISGVNIDGKPVVVGGTYPFVAGKAVAIKVYGPHMIDVDTLKINGVNVDISSADSQSLTLSYTPLASGNAPITVLVGDVVKDTYNLSFGEEGSISITGVTAGGDTLVNGGTTTITDGNSYQINISGRGLSDLTTANFTLPAGSSIAINSQSDTMISATLSSAHAGDFKVTVDGQILFSAALVAANPGIQLDGYSETANGATRSFSTSLQVETNVAKDVYIKGEDADELTQADFVGNGVTINSWDAATGKLNVTKTYAGENAQVYIKDDGTTIATLTLYTPSGGGGDDLIND